MIGGIDNTNNNRFFLKIIPNRSSNTILGILQRHVFPGSIISSDGYPRYPSAIAKFGYAHIIVPHTEGFRNLEGFHINNIENLWSHLKAEYRIRRGVQLNNILYFVYEFYFKKDYSINRNPKNLHLDLKNY